MKNILSWFRSRVGSKGEPNVLMGRMLHMLALTRENELSCDDVYALMEEFVEAVLAGKPLSELMASIEQHLQVCPDCRQEYETLVAMMQTA